MKSDVLRLAEGRWPDKQIPYGGMSDLAKELGVTRSYIQLVLGKEGYASVRACPPAKPRYQCACGKEVSTLRFCDDCKWMTIPCEKCGKDVDRLISEYVEKVASGKYAGRVYCGDCRSGGRPRKCE